MYKREQNKRFSGPWIVVSNPAQEKIEGYSYKENAGLAAQYLTQHEKNNGRENYYCVVYVSNWENLPC